MLDAFANPVYTDVGNSAQHGGSSHVQPNKMAIFMEWHVDTGSTHCHYHVAVQAANASFKFVPVKRALLQRSGLATHWSTTHPGYWTAVSYGCRASQKKGIEKLDPRPLSWSATDGVQWGQEAIWDDCEEPNTAAAIARQ